MICKNCGTNIPETETKCPTCGAENTDETEYISAAGAERAIPKGFSAKKNIVVIIIIAAALLIGGIVTAVTVSNSAAGNISTSETLQLAERYLSEQNYEQAVIEFRKVLEIEPMNVEAYLGLAEAYLSLGETDKAIELLENGIEQTDSSSLKDKLEKIRENTETSAETVTVEEAISEIAATETEETAYETTEPVTILDEELDIATTPVVRITPNDNPILNSDGTITASVILELTNGKYKGSDTFILEWCGNDEWNIAGASLRHEGAEFANPDDGTDFTLKINEGAEKVVLYSTYPSLKSAVPEPTAYGSMGSVTILDEELDIATTPVVRITPNDNPILNSDGTITASVILELTNGKYKGSDTFILEWCGNDEWNIAGASLRHEGAEFANPDDGTDFTLKINEGAEKVVLYSTYPSLKSAVPEPTAYTNS